MFWIALGIGFVIGGIVITVVLYACMLSVFGRGMNW